MATATDAVDEAIAATEQPKLVPVWQGTVTLPTSGRQVALAVPSDLTVLERDDLAVFVIRELGREIGKALEARGPSLVIAKAGPLVVPGRH